MDVTSRVQDSTHTSSITGQNSLSLNGDYQQQNYNLNSSIPSETGTNGLNGVQEENREESKSPTKEELDAAALLGFVGAVVVEGTQVTTVAQNSYASTNGNSLESETPKLLPPISHATAMEIAHSIPLEALPSPSEAAPPAPLNTFPTEPPSIPTPVQITSTTSPSLPIPSEIPPPPQRMEYTPSERVEPLAPAPVPISQPSYSPAPTQPYASAPAPSYTPPIQPTPVAAPISAPAPYAFDTSLETNSAYNQVVESRMDLINGESPVNKRMNEAMNGEDPDREIKRQKN